MPALAKTEPLLDWVHADFQPTGFARSLRSRLGHLLRHRGDVGGVARKMLEEGDLDACHVLYDAMLDANLPTRRCERMVLDCQIVAASERAAAWSPLPVTWAVVMHLGGRPWRVVKASSDPRICPRAYPSTDVRDYTPETNSIRLPGRSFDEKQLAAMLPPNLRGQPLVPTPVRGRVNVPDFLKG